MASPIVSHAVCSPVIPAGSPPKPHASVYEIVTSQILAELERGEVPWRKPWHTLPPANLITKKPYRGINVFLLGFAGYGSQYWLTFNQARQLLTTLTIAKPFEGFNRKHEPGCNCDRKTELFLNKTLHQLDFLELTCPFDKDHGGGRRPAWTGFNLISECFYGGELKSADVSWDSLFQSQLPRPVVWLTTAQQLDHFESANGHSYNNPCEARIIECRIVLMM